MSNGRFLYKLFRTKSFLYIDPRTPSCGSRLLTPPKLSFSIRGVIGGTVKLSIQNEKSELFSDWVGDLCCGNLRQPPEILQVTNVLRPSGELRFGWTSR